MFKKILTFVFCVVLVFGASAMALAKNAEEKTETIVEKMSEPKDDLKGKLGLAFTTGGTGSMRMWITNSLGLDLGASLGITGSSVFGLGLAANIVFPIMEEGPASLYLKPGMAIDFSSSSALGSDINFSFNAGLEAEAFIVKNLIAVGGIIGLNIGINVHSTPAPSVTSTSFLMNLGTSPAALFVRVYM
jgi:hypothetical protein